MTRFRRVLDRDVVYKSDDLTRTIKYAGDKMWDLKIKENKDEPNQEYRMTEAVTRHYITRYSMYSRDPDKKIPGWERV